jgi:hypothetical protein
MFGKKIVSRDWRKNSKREEKRGGEEKNGAGLKPAP